MCISWTNKGLNTINMYGVTTKKKKLKGYFTKPVLACAVRTRKRDTLKGPGFDEVNVYGILNITDKTMCSLEKTGLRMSLHHKKVTFWEAQCGKVIK